MKIPFMVIVGDREIADNKVGVRLRNGEDLGPVNVSDFITRLNLDVVEKNS